MKIIDYYKLNLSYESYLHNELIMSPILTSSSDIDMEDNNVINILNTYYNKGQNLIKIHFTFHTVICEKEFSVVPEQSIYFVYFIDNYTKQKLDKYLKLVAFW